MELMREEQYLTTAALATLGAAVILHVCAVLLGAPLLSHAQL